MLVFREISHSYYVTIAIRMAGQGAPRRNFSSLTLLTGSYGFLAFGGRESLSLHDIFSAGVSNESCPNQSPPWLAPPLHLLLFANLSPLVPKVQKMTN